MTQNSGRGAVWEGRCGGGEGDHMCCAKSTVNRLLDISGWCFHQRAVIHMHENKSNSGDVCVRRVKPDIRMYMGSVCVVACVYLGLCVCVCMCEQVYMSVGVAHFFPHPQIQQGKKPASGKRTDSQGCTVSSAFCTEGVNAIQDLQGQEGVKIRAAKGTIQYKCDMQIQLMFSIAGFVIKLSPPTSKD